MDREQNLPVAASMVRFSRPRESPAFEIPDGIYILGLSILIIGNHELEISIFAIPVFSHGKADAALSNLFRSKSVRTLYRSSKNTKWNSIRAVSFADELEDSVLKDLQ